VSNLESADASSALDRLKSDLGQDAPGLLPGLVSEFLQDAAHLVGRIDAYLGDGSPAEARRPAATLRSTALAFGAIGLADACADLEAALDREPDADHDVRAGRIRHEYDRVAEALASLLG
jgi:HPt (histidine-containing phosphotransfer) domain-containing protein